MQKLNFFMILSEKLLALLFSGSVVSDSLRPQGCSMPGFCVHHRSQSLHKLMSIKSVMPSNHLVLCLSLLLLPSLFPSIRVFSNESTLHMRWPKYWVSASASVLPMNTPDWSPLGWTAWISLQPKGLSRVFSNTIVQKHHFFSSQPSLCFNSHIHTWILNYRVKIVHWIRFSFSTFVIIIWLFITCVSFYWKVKVNWKLTF